MSQNIYSANPKDYIYNSGTGIEIDSANTISVVLSEINIADDGSALTISLSSNTLYIFEDRTSDLTIQLAEPISGIANEYHCYIIVGSTQPTVTWDIQNLVWSGGSAPSMSTGKTYEISIMNNIGIFLEV